MAAIDTTVEEICAAATFDARIAEIRKIPGKHGTDDRPAIFAQVARRLYVPDLTPDFAYIHQLDFYDEPHFHRSYEAASAGTAGFTRTDEATLAACLREAPESLLTFRVIVGLTRDEFAHATRMVEPEAGLSGSVVDGVERRGTALPRARADLLAATLSQIMDGSLFGGAAGDVHTKQDIKADTAAGWSSVERFAADGVPYWQYLHQRHVGGAFRQLLEATSTKRGDIIEDAVEALFVAHGVPFLRTGSHHQADIADRFGLEVRPAPDFVLFDAASDTLMAILECKGANDGGTARDKALRFGRLKSESMRLGGVPVMAVLGGIGWQRVNDTLGPVVADTDGRVFTMSTLDRMLTVAPVPQLIGTAPAPAPVQAPVDEPEPPPTLDLELEDRSP